MKNLAETKNLKSKYTKVKNLKSKNGSTLIWVLILMLVLGILITGGLMIAQSYTSRSLDQHVEQQSYYSALSVTKSIAEWFDGTSQDSPGTKQLAYIENLKTAENNTVTFDSTVDSSMGESETTISMDPNSKNITISTTATYNDKSSTVQCILKNSSGVTGSEGDPSEVKLLVPPSDQDTVSLNDSVESTSTTAIEEDGQFFARRNIGLNLRSNYSFKLANAISPDSNSLWRTQYYKLIPEGGNKGTDVYLKLTNAEANNGGFPAVDSSGEMQNRYMGVYGSDTTFGSNLNSFTIYTNDSADQIDEPPRNHIIILPNMTEKIITESWSKRRDYAITGLVDTTYENTHIQIHDGGEVPNTTQKAILLIPSGTHFKDSTIYTRRNTIINMPYYAYGGFFWKHDLAHSWTGETEYYSTKNPNNLTLNGTAFSMDGGKLVVADNVTQIIEKAVINGDIIIKKTKTDRGTLLLGRTKTATATIKGGSIYVKDGGYLDLSAWHSYCYNDIFVEPGGTVVLNGTQLHCNVYALKGRSKTTGEPAVVKVTTQTLFYKNMETLDGETVPGGIFLEATDESDGAKLERGDSQGYVDIHEQYSGAIHIMPGASVDSRISSRTYCDGVKNRKLSNIDPVCTCGVKVPQYGNTINGWQIYGYNEN